MSKDLEVVPVDQYNMKLTEQLAAKVLGVVDAGLSTGMGQPVPGKMCVEAAVNFALNGDHNDEPDCVSEDLRSFKIPVNDEGPWTNNLERAVGMRRLAIAQLGTNSAKYQLDWKKLKKTVKELVAKKYASFGARDEEVIEKYRDTALDGLDESNELLKSLEQTIKDVKAGHKQLEAVVSLTKNKTAKTSDIEKLVEKMDSEIEVPDQYNLSLGDLFNNSYGDFDSLDESNLVNYLDDPFDVETMNEFANALHEQSGEKKAVHLFFNELCENVVQGLIKMKTPGSKFLYLTEKGGKTAAKKLMKKLTKKTKKVVKKK